MRSSSELFKDGIMKGYTTQPNVQLTTTSKNSTPGTINDMTKYTQAVEGEMDEPKEATGAASAGAYSAPLFTKEETKENEKIPGGLSSGKSLEDLAKKHNVNVDDLFEQLRKGIKVEMEHTSEMIVALEIAMDHLAEDPTYYDKLKKIETKEATTSASVGSYETPAFLAKNSKNWRGGKKPLYKGGKFVEVKKKCLTFPYCNQGAGAIKIFENETLKSAISNVSKKMGVDEQIIKRILYHNFKRKNKK